MGVPYSVTYTTTGAQVPWIVDYSQTPFSASVAAILVGAATGTFGIEYTLDDVNNAAVTPVWFPDATLGTGHTTSGVTSYSFPVMAIRANIASLTGSLRFVGIQGTQQP